MGDLEDRFFADLEALGEAEVRLQCSKRMYDAIHLALAKEWLRRQEEARRESSIREDKALAREANDLASTANRQAKQANTIAKIAIIISAIATIAAVISLAHH